jgi:hypothetical protein
MNADWTIGGKELESPLDPNVGLDVIPRPRRSQLF